MSGRQTPGWYRRWFGEEYLSLYPHRDREEAEAGVQLVLRVCGRPRRAALDLACGAGRHMIALQRQGIEAVGLDLSMALLREARKLDPALRLVRGDMRQLPFATGSFDLVTNFFTSFGYFDEADDDLRVLSEIRRVLKADGCFALDFLNAQRVRDELIPRDERRLGEKRVVQQRRLESTGKVVTKTIEIYSPGHDTPESTFFERVRLYSADELNEMLQSAGLEPEHAYGDYAGAPPRPDSPRHILLGQAT